MEGENKNRGMGQSSKHYNLLGERKDNKHIFSGNRQETSNGKSHQRLTICSIEVFIIQVFINYIIKRTMQVR